MSLKGRHVSRGDGGRISGFETGILARAAVRRRTLTDIIFHGGDEGLWALCEIAFVAVLQAPVGALFASMGAPASMAPGAGPGHGAFG